MKNIAPIAIACLGVMLVGSPKSMAKSGLTLPNQQPATIAQAGSPVPTWRELVAQGKTPYSRDYDLPPGFRDGLVYIERGSNAALVFIVKPGLPKYPNSIREPGASELLAQYMDAGVAIKLSWVGRPGWLSESITLSPNGTVCYIRPAGEMAHSTECLKAKFLDEAELIRIIRSGRNI